LFHIVDIVRIRELEWKGMGMYVPEKDVNGNKCLAGMGVGMGLGLKLMGM